MYAIQKIESEKVWRIWLEGYSPAGGGGAGRVICDAIIVGRRLQNNIGYYYNHSEKIGVGDRGYDSHINGNR